MRELEGHKTKPDSKIKVDGDIGPVIRMNEETTKWVFS